MRGLSMIDRGTQADRPSAISHQPSTLRDSPGASPIVPESILRRIAQGDRSAVRECIARHGGLVWSLARRSTEGRADAEDAVQEVFIRLWTHASRFDASIASETTFVAMIARRTLIDRRRKQARRPALDALPDGLAGESDPPLDWLERLDEGARAARALDGLGDDQRRVLTLSIYRGLTYDEIAKGTGLPLGTVKTHARRGLINLRKALDAPEQSRPASSKQDGGDS